MIIKGLAQLKPNSRLFLAEGDSEKFYYQQVLERHGVSDSSIFCFEGISSLGTFLKGVADGIGFENLKCLGLMIDANSDPISRAASVGGLFRRHGVSLDNGKIFRNEICATNPCPIGIFISPGSRRIGSIEFMIFEEVREHPLHACIQEYAACATGVHGAIHEKALIQMFISSLSERLCGVGRAFQAKIFHSEHHAYEELDKLIAALCA